MLIGEGKLISDWQRPINRWIKLPNSIDNDEVAVRIGMRGGTSPDTAELQILSHWQGRRRDVPSHALHEGLLSSREVILTRRSRALTLPVTPGVSVAPATLDDRFVAPRSQAVERENHLDQQDTFEYRVSNNLCLRIYYHPKALSGLCRAGIDPVQTGSGGLSGI